MKDILFSFKKHWAFWSIAFLAATVVFYRIDKPFIGHHDWNSVWFATIARNHLRYGFLGTRFGDSLNAGIYKPSELGFQTHHLPFGPMFVAFSFALFGQSEWAARLVPVTATLFSIILIFLIGKYLYGVATGVCASLFSLATPMVIYFSKIPVHETIVLPFILVLYYCYILSFTLRKKSYLIGLFIFTILGELVGWAAYYMAAYITLHSLLFGKYHQKIVILLIPLSLLMFGLHLFHIIILTGSIWGGGLWDVFLFRFNPEMSAAKYGYSHWAYIVQESRFIIIYFTKILTGLSVIWLCLFGVKRFIRRKFLMRSDIFLFFLLPFGLTHMLFLRNLAFIHDYMIYYLLPYIALSAGVIVANILARLHTRALAALTLVVVVSLVFFERIQFVRALFQTDGGERTRQIGYLMQQKTKEEEMVFVASNQYREFWDVFIAYYGDRRVGYGERLPENWRDYGLIIRPKDHDALKFEEKAFLDGTLPRQENDQFIWYEL